MPRSKRLSGMYRARPTEAVWRANEQIRKRLCLECARIMAEEGVRDYQFAKRKAGARLVVRTRGLLPSNQEVEQALHEYLQLFQPDMLKQRLEHYYALALDAMYKLAPFRPRLVGSLLRGSVTEYSPVELHVFADAVEDLNLFLTNQGIPCELAERRLRFGGDRYQNQPMCRFTTDGIMIELIIFMPRHMKEPPLCPVDGKPMRRMGIKELKAMASIHG